VRCGAVLGRPAGRSDSRGHTAVSEAAAAEFGECRGAVESSGPRQDRSPQTERSCAGGAGHRLALQHQVPQNRSNTSVTCAYVPLTHLGPQGDPGGHLVS